MTVRLLRAPFNVAVSSFMHLLHLPFHEAGHILFSPFGEFMTALGGSLLQVAIPAVCAVAFLRQRDDPFGAAVCGWWTGESLVDLAPYIADARSLQLMLLGGPADEIEGHDWEFILETLGWLRFDQSLGRAAFVAGGTVMVTALVWAAAVLVAQVRRD
jgi:hypothetical protein